MSNVTQDHFARTPPAYRHKIAHAAADDQTGRAGLVTEEVVGVENRSWKQAIAEFEGHELAPVKVPGENEIKSTPLRSIPYSRVVRAEHAHVTAWLHYTVGAHH